MPVLAAQKKNENKSFFAALKKRIPRDLDEHVHTLHEDVFSQTDCLSCANCCRTLGPRITEKDIERLAKHLRVKPSSIVTQHLRVDEDGDFVFQHMPCPFLMTDNCCFVYDARPRACREYPHTDRRKFSQLLDITLKNTEVCPAVYEIVEGMKKKFT